MRGTKRKVLVITVVLMVAALLSTPFIGAVMAGYGGKNKASFEWYVEQWPLGRENRSEDTRIHAIEKKDGNMTVIHNVHTYGEPPLTNADPDDPADDVYLYPKMPPSLWNPAWDDYPNGGIRITVTPEGEDSYTLLGTFEMAFLYIAFKPKSGILSNVKWSFTITEVEDGKPPVGWEGSTMYGTMKNSLKLVSVAEVKSTKGTGIFQGAFLRGTLNVIPGGVFLVFPPASSADYVLFQVQEGSAEIVFP